ncbi:mucin-4-like [Columba livia]|uniref:Mucin-4-like n=1 Tax=Columba livia TaxID=8932 RepID=A0A2I0LHW2_COLLI|nr:mucin-4-like [Columba livia]
MGTRRWTTSTFVGCCIWILHGLRAAGAIPVTTEGSFAAGTVSPIATESEGPPALVMGTAETSTTVANAEIAESILAGSSSSLSFPAGAQTDALVTATIAYGSTALTLINVTKPLNTSQENKGGSAAPTAATSTAAIPEQYPAVTPEAALDVTGAVPTAPLGTTPLFAGVKEDVPAAVTREEAENLDPTVGDVLFPTLPAVTWGAQPAAGSPVGAGVTVLPSQGVTTAIEAPAAPEVTEDMATSLLDPSVPTDAQSDTNPPVLDTVLPTEDPFSGNKVTTSLANGVLAASGSSLHAAFPGQRETPRGFPATARPVVSCSPITTSPVPPAPIPGVRKVLPSPAVATVTSHASSPVFPAPPGGPVTALNLLPSPTVPAIPLYGYGARENDREYVERKVDFNSPLFKPETGFPFGNTLRSSLYFTDNGQIIFPASDNSIFTYPNPPPRGFSGREEVPMIAVFWDNADFSRGVGTTFYQEFPTLNTDKPPFVRDVEAKVRRYLRSSYSAAWTLKITWEKAPAYGARTDTRRTITYQAVLTTDGFRSYVLMLYQAGGMQWDYTRLAATNVLIGYTSGDGFYRNDDLTRRPPAAKYRPDQFRGYNTDLRGLWIYKLESRVGINYRLKCLAWTGQQQEPRMWSQGLPACPCTLQQGQRDPRFKSSRGGK